MRLTPIGYEIGLATEERFHAMESKREERDRFIDWCAAHLVKSTDKINNRLKELGSAPLSASVRLIDLLRRPQLDLKILSEIVPELRKRIEELPEDRREEIAEAAQILIKYEGYIRRERELAEKQQRLEYVRIPAGFDFMSVKALSTESRQKLERIRPATIGQASRIPGVSPADVNVLLLLLHR